VDRQRHLRRLRDHLGQVPGRRAGQGVRGGEGHARLRDLQDEGARELLGGNGILLENYVGRFVADSEAIYSYEGTREINTLIVGRAITGISAFV
jgi:hypothetical protein